MRSIPNGRMLQVLAEALKQRTLGSSTVNFLRTPLHLMLDTHYVELIQDTTPANRNAQVNTKTLN